MRIGEKRIPALLQDAQGKINFNPEAGITLTSRFGPRAAPTPGASSYHQGEDWALPEGTPVFYEGGGTFKPLANQGGYGNLATLTTGDNKYEIGFGHMKSLGQASALPGQTTQPQMQQGGSTRTEDILKAFLYGAGYKDKSKEPKETFQESLKRQLLESVASSPSPSQFLSSFMVNNPYAAVPQFDPEALLGDLYS